MPARRPAPRYEDGYFIPSVPYRNPKDTKDYNWKDSLASLRTLPRNPLEGIGQAAYKDPVVQFKMFGTHFTIINDLELIRHCFVNNANNYKFQAIRQRILKPILREGLLTAEGEPWRRARHTLTPLFTPKHIRSFASGMIKTANRELPRLLQHGQIVQFSDLMSSFTYLILSDALFSSQISENREDVLEKVSTILKFMGRPDPLDILGAPDWVPRLTKIRGLKSVEHLRALLISGYYDRLKQSHDGQTLPDDFLSLLMQCTHEDGQSLNEQEIIDHLITFIGAGHETTARALSWLFYLLDNDTEARNRLEAEVDNLDFTSHPDSWSQELPWTKACIEEAMRLFPPAPIITRSAVNADKYGKYEIPKNGVALLNLFVLHRHTQLWERPDAFDPMRFLGQARKNIDLYQYLPFGLGPRVCIGQRFAMQEALILTALLAKNYQFHYAGGEEVPWPVLRVTIQPENGLPMKVIKR